MRNFKGALLLGPLLEKFELMKLRGRKGLVNENGGVLKDCATTSDIQTHELVTTTNLLVCSKILIGLFSLVSLVSMTTCAKHDVSKNAINIKLKDKPLSDIKANIQGKWQLLYIRGGLCGTCSQKRESEFYEFINDNITWEIKGVIIADTTVVWVNNNVFGDTSWTMEYHDKKMSPGFLTPDGIYNDTLVLYQKGPDGLYFHLITSH